MATTKKAAGKTSTTSEGSGSDASPSGIPSFSDIGKLIEKFKVPGIDIAAIVEAQRKDMEALAEANRQAYEGIKALAQRRNEILQESLVEWQEAMKDADGKAALAKGAAAAKKGVQQAITNF